MQCSDIDLVQGNTRLIGVKAGRGQNHNTSPTQANKPIERRQNSNSQGPENKKETQEMLGQSTHQTGNNDKKRTGNKNGSTQS